MDLSEKPALEAKKNRPAYSGTVLYIKTLTLN